MECRWAPVILVLPEIIQRVALPPGERLEVGGLSILPRSRSSHSCRLRMASCSLHMLKLKTQMGTK